MAGVSEALALGAALGLDPKALAGVMAGSTARCWSLTEYPPVPVRRRRGALALTKVPYLCPLRL
jgi:3-hydroxyisobutyrate dehydrogenase-like beta-hydroxyacid dehydrogenase